MAQALYAARPLPNIARCLAGDEAVLSWDNVFSALLSHDEPPSDLYKAFLAENDDRILSVSPAFQSRSSATKSQFDQAVSGINVSSEDQQKELDQIKADALWLSEYVNLEETESLRIALVENQNRPESRLNAGFSDAELASLRHAVGAEHAHTLSLTPGGPYSRMEEQFDSDEARKVRLLHIFYRGQVAMMGLAREALQTTIAPPTSDDNESRWQSVLGTATSTSQKDAVQNITSAINTLVEELQGSREWAGLNIDYANQVETIFATCKLQCIALNLQMLLLRVLYANETTTGDTMGVWLHFLFEHQHFSNLRSEVPAQQEVMDLIKSSVSYIEVALIQPMFALNFLVDPAIADVQASHTGSHYFLDVDRIGDMFQYMIEAATALDPCASPAVLAWAMVFLQIKVLAVTAKNEREQRNVQRAINASWNTDSQGRRFSGSSISSSNESIFETIVSQIPYIQSNKDGLDFMLESAVVECNVFKVMAQSAADTRQVSPVLASFQLDILQNLLAAARPNLGYTPELFGAQLAVLEAGTRVVDDKVPFRPLPNFIGDPFLREHFLECAAARFPYESLPFLKMSAVLAQAKNQSLFREDGVHYITYRLQYMESFTGLAVGAFEAYHTTHEDENANLVELNQPVSILDHWRTRLLSNAKRGQRQDQVEVIPGGTTGKVITESSPPVIRWTHSYSGLSLVGKWLEMHVTGDLANIVSPFESADDVATAVLGLLSSLLGTTYSYGIDNLSTNNATQLCEDILAETSALLGFERDIVDCVFDLIEQQLVSTRRFSPTTGCELLASAVEILTVLCKIRPVKVWPLLAKSSALAAYGAKRSIFAVVSSVEVSMEAFPLLEACNKLLQATIALVLGVSTHSEVVRGLRGRSNPAQRPLATAILGLTENLYAAFEAIGSWSFVDSEQKQNITSTLCDAFSDILYRSFGTGVSASTDSNITVCYRPAADFLISALSGTGVQSLGSGPIAVNLVSRLLASPPPALIRQDSSDLRSLLSLARVHLGCAQLSENAVREVSTTLINLFPVYARLPLLHAKTTRPCLALQCDVLDAFKLGSAPHLLSHLGAVSCLGFVDSLRNLNARAFEEVHMTWRLISRLMSLDQQWTAVVLITGSPPGRERRGQDVQKLATRGKPLLQQALDKLVDISNTHPTVAVALLHLLTEAQQSWPSVTDAIASRRGLFPALIDYVNSRTTYSNSDVRQAVHNQVAAGVTELSVISLHVMSFRNQTQYTAFVPLLDWLTANALRVGAYNASMHTNLRKNFSMKYSGLELDVVKRTGVIRVPYGSTFCYDLDFAGRVLGQDAHWNRGPQSFHAELERANVNLSIVDSELNLLKSFKYLCSEHAMFFAKHSEVQISLSQVVDICLKANTSLPPPESMFDGLPLSRIEIAALVLGPLVTVGAEGPEFTALLRAAYNTSRERNGSYDLAVANNDLKYWRAMLNVIRLSLQFHTSRSLNRLSVKGFESINIYNTLFCEIAGHIVGEGLRTVVATLQDQKQDSGNKAGDVDLVNESDVLLLLNIFQTMLRISSLPQFASQLADTIISTGTTQSLLLLFSWSHILDDTPVYGVLAARSLAAISKLAPVAEDLAVEGVFNRLLIAKTSQRIQKMAQGVGHIDQRPDAAMLYQIWSDGFLRITLNVLDAIGGGVAAEAAGFINSFPLQLNRASLSVSTSPNRVSGSEGLTLGAACELASLSLISFVLDRFRLAGASSAVDSTAIALLEGFDEHKSGIAADVKDILDQEVKFRLRREVPVNNAEMVWAQTRLEPGKKDGQTVLDKKMMKEFKDARRCLVADGEE